MSVVVTVEGVVITASRHAVEKARERIPGVGGMTWRDSSNWVEKEAARAFSTGSRARRVPRWCVRTWSNGYAYRQKLTSEGTSRFVWLTEDHLFLIRRVPAVRNGVDTWLVVTVMVPE